MWFHDRDDEDILLWHVWCRRVHLLIHADNLQFQWQQYRNLILMNWKDYPTLDLHTLSQRIVPEKLMLDNVLANQRLPLSSWQMVLDCLLKELMGLEPSNHQYLFVVPQKTAAFCQLHQLCSTSNRLLEYDLQNPHMDTLVCKLPLPFFATQILWLSNRSWTYMQWGMQRP